MAVLWTIWRVSPSTRFSSPPKPSPVLRWDIFCRVIDNHGDLGVCWRLSADLAQRGHTVRLWVDDASALTWMAPTAQTGVAVHTWPDLPHAYSDCADVVVEAFGCDLPESVQTAIAQSRSSVKWINLEYLSAEAYVERQHGLPSPVMSGPAKGCTKWFYFPGFTPGTGGLLREADLLSRQHSFDRAAWRAAHAPHASADACLISLFCYEPAGLPALLSQLSNHPAQLLVTPGRAQAAVRDALSHRPTHPSEGLSWQPLDYTDQTGFDHMLWACDLNLVRGEDSLVRALWAGRPFVWHIYPQDDGAHHAKLDAFLDWLDAPDSLRRFHRIWNGIAPGALPVCDADTLHAWTHTVQTARERLLMQASLTDQLVPFVMHSKASNR